MRNQFNERIHDDPKAFTREYPKDVMGNLVMKEDKILTW